MAVFFQKLHISKAIVLTLVLFSLLVVIISLKDSQEHVLKDRLSTQRENASKDSYGLALQIPFVKNEGQTDEGIAFYSKTSEGLVYVSRKGEIFYSLTNEEAGSLKGWVLKEVFPTQFGGEIKGEVLNSARVNYFRGNNPNKWRRNISTYSLINLGEIESGIEVKLKTNGRTVEKLFYVRPGVSPNQIHSRIEGAQDLKVNVSGELEALTDKGTIKFTKPIAYQEINGKRKEVDVAYRVQGDQYSFRVGSYDPTREIIIDPLLASTFLGGDSIDDSLSMTFGIDGSIYIAGNTLSSVFPVTPGAYDTESTGSRDPYIAKFDNKLENLLACTFFGGSDEYDAIDNIRVDNDGNVYANGVTYSSDFPVTAGAFDTSFNGDNDAFISKFDSNLENLLNSTYLGGDGADNSSVSTSPLYVDDDGSIYIAGSSGSSNFPTTPDAYERTSSHYANTYVSKLDSNLQNLLSSTFVGGCCRAFPTSLMVDANGTVYLSGGTYDSNFPVTPGVYDTTHNGDLDLFIVKLDNDLQTLLASTFLGGNDEDYMDPLVLDEDGNIYVAGVTYSTDFPTTPGAYDTTYHRWYDGYVSKLDNRLQTLLASTYIAGSDDDEWIDSLAIGPEGGIYVVGFTYSEDFPTTPDAYDATFNGYYDIFISQFDSNLQNLLVSTFFGGSDNDGVGAFFIDSNNQIYLTGWTDSPEFPVTPQAYDTTFAGGDDAFIAKFDSLTSRCGHTTVFPLVSPLETSVEYPSLPLKDFDVRTREKSKRLLSEEQEHRFKDLQGRLGKNVRGRWSHGNPIGRSLWREGGYLTKSNDASRTQIAFDFLKKNFDLLGMTTASLSNFKMDSAYETKHNGVTHITLIQYHQEIPVFQSQIRFHVDPEGRIIYIGGEYYPEVTTLDLPRLSAAQALQVVAQEVAPDIDFEPQVLSESADPTLKTVFRKGIFNRTDAFHSASLVVFPMSGGFRLGWKVLFHKNDRERYFSIVDAVTGEVLYRVNRVQWSQPQGLIFEENPDDSAQALQLFVGDPIASPDGWLYRDTGVYQTLGGNNTCTQEDRDTNNISGYSPSSSEGHFEYPFQNAYESSNGVDANTDLDAALTNLFYQVNFAHDYYYGLGFDEEGGNFQRDNLEKSGLENDEVWADGQDGWGTGTELLCQDAQGNPILCRNNANFYTPADGYDSAEGKPRMQMYLFDSPRQVDGDFDGKVILHEYTHGVSTRLVGGPSEVLGLLGIQSGAMGEGWSDWFAASLYDDPIIGEYVSGNSSKGIRRYALDRNPLTYGDLCQGPNGCEVHDDGEIWSGILWDLREKFIEKYDYEEGKAQVEQLVIDGMKFTKVNPSMLDARDAILAADLANEGGNQDLLWKVFACTGMGVPASTTDHNDANPVESFDLPDGTDCRGRVKLPWQSLREILGSILQDILGRWFNRI